MSAHLALRSGNPALSADTFTSIPRTSSENVMTIGGTVNKTAFALAILFMAATYVWSQGVAGALPTGFIWGGFIGGVVVALVTVFKQTWAPYTTPLYAGLEGLALGGISFIFEQQYPGIVSQAIFLTFGTLGGLLLAYRSGVIRATENFKLGVFAATGRIGIVYLLSFVLGFFGIEASWGRWPWTMHSAGWGMFFNLAVCISVSAATQSGACRSAQSDKRQATPGRAS